MQQADVACQTDQSADDVSTPKLKNTYWKNGKLNAHRSVHTAAAVLTNIQETLLKFQRKKLFSIIFLPSFSCTSIPSCITW